MSEDRSGRLETLLRRQGAVSAAAIGQELGLSQPTVSRLLASEGERIVRIGRARAARYALAHPVGRAGSHWPLFRLRADASAEALGTLHTLHNDAFWFDSDGPRPVLHWDDFAGGLYPGLPWFMDDQRPQGFLGRGFGRRVAADIGAPLDITLWTRDDIVLALLRHGDDEPGDLVLGETSLQRAQQEILDPRNTVARRARAQRYPELAEAVLAGEPVGSSAGGEHPKFAITLEHAGRRSPVIVKFSDRLATAAGRRWGDLLVCEHLACEVLQADGVAAASSAVVEAGHRLFLESTRFDRTPELGRRGFVSLFALDAAFYGHGRLPWWQFAPQLQRDGWIDAADAQRLRRYGWFGALIGNTDMHLGNAGLHLDDTRPLVLTPIWDMLPMLWQPASNGEIVPREFRVLLPTPDQREDWAVAARLAEHFWERVRQDTRISREFRRIAADAGAALAKAAARHG